MEAGQTGMEGHGIPKQDPNDTRPDIMLGPDSILPTDQIVEDAMETLRKNIFLTRNLNNDHARRFPFFE